MTKVGFHQEPCWCITRCTKKSFGAYYITSSHEMFLTKVFLQMKLIAILHTLVRSKSNSN